MRKEVHFDIKDILPIAFTLVVAGLGIGYGLELSGDLQQDQCTGALQNWDSAERICWSCPNTTFSTFSTGTNVCNNGTASINASAHEYSSDIAYNTTGDMMTGISNISAKFPTLGTIIVAAVIIGVLVTYLFVRMR